METAEKYRRLTDEEARSAREKYGANTLAKERKSSLLKTLAGFFKEPVFLLLIGAACLYFFLGEPRDGAVIAGEAALEIRAEAPAGLVLVDAGSAA